MFVGLRDLTIVIPTVSRPLFVLRQFTYWGETDARVVILDGATTPIRIPENLLRKNIRYVHTGTRFNERLATAADYVSTKYCVLLTDDEFFLPSGLLAAIRRLEADPSIIGCIGRCLYFFVDQGRFLVKDAYREWSSFSANARTMEERLDEDLPPNKTHKAQFAVMRAAEWATMFRSSYSVFFSSGYTYERLLNLSRTVLGRTELLEDLLWMRSMENPPISSVNVPRTGAGGFLNWAQSSDYAGEVATFRSIANKLLTDGGLAPETANEFERRFFEVGVKQTIARKSKLKKRARDGLRDILLASGSKRFRLFVKRHIPNQFLKLSGWQGYSLDEMAASLTARGTHFSMAELERIRDLSLETARTISESKGINHGS